MTNLIISLIRKSLPFILRYLERNEKTEDQIPKEKEDLKKLPPEAVDPEKKESMNFRNKITVILSAGHGATDPTTGFYHCLAGGKQHTFSDGENIREGDLNRIYSDELERQLLQSGYKVAKVHHEYLDHSLDMRIKKAQQVKGECCLIPIHFNASPEHNAKGFEVFTTRGQTASDDLAEFIWFKVNLLRRIYDDLRMRSDMASDGDHDKEANFKEIRAFENYHKSTEYSGAHAYLEGGFFDYKPELRRLQDQDYIELYCASIVKGIDLFYKR